jgi:hypothetical protein
VGFFQSSCRRYLASWLHLWKLTLTACPLKGLWTQTEFRSTSPTRREVLRATATNFEGFLAPVSIVTKLILQKDFRARYTWDSSFKPELAKEWQDWVGFLMNFKTSIRIPVKLFPFLSKKYQATSNLLR